MPVAYLILLALFAAGRVAGAPVLKSSPVSLTFTYQTGQTGLPSPQTLNVSPVATGGSLLTVAVSASGGPWLAVSPSSGPTPLNVRVLVNPSTMPVGSYEGRVTLSVLSSTGDPLSIPVRLTVKAAPAVLGVTPATVSFVYRRGDPVPEPTGLNFTTSGSLLSATSTVSGGPWLGVSPSSLLVFPAFVTSVKLAVNPAGLAPGGYRGTVTVNAPDAANKTQAVVVTLTVQPGVPRISTIWPERVVAPSEDTTITITGENFYASSVVKVNGLITLKPTILGPSLMTVVLPAAILASPANLSVAVVNPDGGGGTSQPPMLFSVLSQAPRIAAVTDAASFRVRPLATGQLAVIFGSGLGPEGLATFVAPPEDSPIAGRLVGTEVRFDEFQAPVLYVSPTEVSAVLPYGLAGRTETRVQVIAGGIPSEAVTIPLAAAAPGIFTAAGTGTGQAAGYHVNPETGDAALNSENNPARNGYILVLYATGEGRTEPELKDGLIATAPSAESKNNVKLMIAGQEAEVLYAGSAPGLVAGVFQIFARIPNGLKADKATPVIVAIGDAESPPGVTIAIR